MIVKLSTKTLASLLLVTAVASAVPGISQLSPRKRRHESQFDRLLQRHDRKGELRAEILGVKSIELRSQLKTSSFEEIIKRSGFATQRAFRIALMGKLKSELRQRGWTTQRIERHVTARSPRIG